MQLIQTFTFIIFILFASQSCNVSVAQDEEEIDIENENIIFDHFGTVKSLISAKLSDHLKIVISYYNDTTFLIDRVETVKRYDPFDALHAEGLNHQSRMNAVQRRLDKYLINMNNNNPDTDEEFERFMSSIDADIEKLNDEFDYGKVDEETKLLSKINKEKEDTIKMAQSLLNRKDEFEKSLTTLFAYGINLDEPPKNEPTPENFDLSSLTALMEEVKHMENEEDKQMKKWNVANADFMHLQMMKIVTDDLNDREPGLRHFTNVINKKRQTFVKLIPEVDAVYDKMNDKLMKMMMKTLDANQKLVDLISEVREVRDKHVGGKDEL